MVGYATDPLIVTWLMEGGDADLPEGSYFAPLEKSGQTVLYPEILSSMQTFLQAKQSARTGTAVVEIVGAPGSGRRTLAGQLATSVKKPLLVVKVDGRLDGPNTISIAEPMKTARRAARLHDALLYLDCKKRNRPSTWKSWHHTLRRMGKS